jgi:hypothetical protein
MTNCLCGRRALLGMQHVRMVLEWTGQSLSSKLECQRPLVQYITMSMRSWILWRHCHVRSGVSSTVSGTSERE